ncbi:phosphopantothenate--cysteine ligase [Streptococcus caprae]|uniref:Phosphopantothenate--cysteine ligase n=1 Tax=Streptococcus caprae TaxID=1640501 RepID=A0ABV8CVI8_9STRE
MNILITSGGTTELIDDVRGITNHASGHLGKIMAEHCLKEGHQVTLVTTKEAVKPEKQANLTVVLISDVASLMETLKPLVKSHDVLIHSMAVSDYTPVYMTDLDELQTVSDPALLLTKKNTEKKISSNSDVQVLFLKKTPKVISHVKEWNPTIKLVGFKLLVDVTKEELFSVARKSLINNKADFIVANDLTEIDAKRHHAYLVDETNETLVTTKQAIAEMILKRVSHD